MSSKALYAGVTSKNSEVGNRGYGGLGTRTLPRLSVQLLTGEQEGAGSSFQSQRQPGDPGCKRPGGECLVIMVKAKQKHGGEGARGVVQGADTCHVYTRPRS